MREGGRDEGGERKREKRERGREGEREGERERGREKERERERVSEGERERDSFIFPCYSSYSESVQAKCCLEVYHENRLIPIQLPGSATVSEVNNLNTSMMT